MAIPEALLAYGAYKIYQSVKEDLKASKKSAIQLPESKTDLDSKSKTETELADVLNNTVNIEEESINTETESFSIAGMIK